MERILNMILRQVVRRGVNSGFNAVGRKMQGRGPQSNEERARTQQVQGAGKNMRQVSRVLRRFTRF